jgi:parvulin-like peptidyl-prolyl isomerase
VKRLLIIAVLLISGLLSACGTTENYAAKVNGNTISIKTIEDELHAVTSNPRYLAALDQQFGGSGNGSGLQSGGDNTVNAQYTASVVFNRVLVALIDQADERENVTITPQQRAEAEQSVRSDLGEAALFDSLPASYRDYLINRQSSLTALLAARNTEAAQRAEYEKNKETYTEYCIRHILVQGQPEADAIRGRITSGEDFAAIARTSSLDNQGGAGGSAAEGGSLGCVSGEDLSQYVAPFRDAAKALAVNELSQPVQTDFGFHLVQVTSKNLAPFEQVREQIARQLQNSSAFFMDQLKDAKVEVNPRYGKYVPGDAASGNIPRIEPPTPVVLAPPTTAGDETSSPFGGGSGSGSGNVDPNSPAVPQPPQ